MESMTHGIRSSSCEVIDLPSVAFTTPVDDVDVIVLLPELLQQSAVPYLSQGPRKICHKNCVAHSTAAPGTYCRHKGILGPGLALP